MLKLDIEVVDEGLEYLSGFSHSLSIETIATMCMSLQETMIKLQIEVHVHDEREMMLQHMMDLQAMEIKYLKEEFKIAL